MGKIRPNLTKMNQSTLKADLFYLISLNKERFELK